MTAKDAVKIMVKEEHGMTHLLVESLRRGSENYVRNLEVTAAKVAVSDPDGMLLPLDEPAGEEE